MPGGDRTGPRGMGPMTGRGAGYCAGYAVPGFANLIPGRGFGLGWGGGWGGGWGRGWGGGWGGGWGRGWRWRHQYYATGLPGWARFGYASPWAYGPDVVPPAPEEEAGFLKSQAEWLQQQLDAIGQRIQELEQKE